MFFNENESVWCAYHWYCGRLKLIGLEAGTYLQFNEQSQLLCERVKFGMLVQRAYRPWNTMCNFEARARLNSLLATAAVAKFCACCALLLFFDVITFRSVSTLVALLLLPLQLNARMDISAAVLRATAGCPTFGFKSWKAIFNVFVFSVPHERIICTFDIFVAIGGYC